MTDSTSNPAPLAGKIAVVTGGSSGIGAACARALAAAGATLVVGYFNGADRADALIAELPGSGHRALRIPLTSDDEHAGVAKAVGDAFGRVDVLVNSAGYTQRIAHKDVQTLTPALFDEIMRANAGGPYSIIRALLPLLQASGDCVVVNVSSLAGVTGIGSNIAYGASKAALDTMTRSLARAFGPGIRFLNVSPGAVDTDFVKGRPREELLAKAATTPLGRAVTAEDVAMSVMACVTHLRTSTGVRILVDGGQGL